MTTGGHLHSQPPPLGIWFSPMKFTGPFQGCGNNQDEKFYAVHSSVIPVGPHRGKVIVWDRSSALLCSTFNGALSGDRDQRWAIVDPEAQTIQYFSWTIPAAFAPPLYRPIPAVPAITNGGQGLFCSGHCWLPDGRLMVIGGDDWTGALSSGYAAFTGARLISIYDPLNGPNGTWSTLKQLYPTAQSVFLDIARWYPTAVVAYDPTQPVRAVKVIVLGGIEEYVPEPPDNLICNGVFLATDRAYLTHEAYDITEGLAGQPWTITKDRRAGSSLPPNYTPNTPLPGVFIGPTTATSVEMPDYQLGLSLFYYARAHYLSNGVFGPGNNFPNGIVWAAGMAVDTAWVDHPTNPNLWNPPHPIIKPTVPMLEEPTAVLLPASLGTGGEDRIALFGGQFGMDHTGVITNYVHVLNARSPAPTWSTTSIPPLNHQRKFANSVLLPDRSVLVTGGGTNPLHGGHGGEVFTPEVFRGGQTWEECAAEDSPRTYHSGALLLPSGRVVSLGGDSRTWDLQVFQPHYIHDSTTRPSITSSPATIAYGTTFSVGLSLYQGRTLQNACLIAPGSLTHSHDPNQRLVELGITSSTTTSATLSTPANPTLAPYGYYMLFVVDSLGDVSVAAWTQLL